MKDSTNKTFNHFKIHTQYSICEGAIKIEQLKDYCKTNKIQSLGISDTHILSGALEFSETLSSIGTQPIIGTQILFKYKNFTGLIPLIAKNSSGYKNIIELSSKSYLENSEGTYPHCSFEDLLILLANSTRKRTLTLRHPTFISWYNKEENSASALSTNEVFATCPSCNSLLAVVPQLLTIEDKCPHCNCFLVIREEE